MTFHQWLEMGGYAFYVWTAYALAAAILSLNVILPWRRQVVLRRSIARRKRRQV
ncbi:MAG: heme exporter protein CcmD [Gammaproteobacteria bacterium]